MHRKRVSNSCPLTHIIKLPICQRSMWVLQTTLNFFCTFILLRSSIMLFTIFHYKSIHLLKIIENKNYYYYEINFQFLRSLDYKWSNLDLHASDASGTWPRMAVQPLPPPETSKVYLPQKFWPVATHILNHWLILTHV